MTVYEKELGFIQTYMKWILIHVGLFCITAIGIAIYSNIEYFRDVGYISSGFLASSLLSIFYAPCVVIGFCVSIIGISLLIAIPEVTSIQVYEYGYQYPAGNERAYTCFWLSGFWFIVGIAVAIGNGWIR